nr:hypothetical protein [uncultured Holophaga sp.]
MKRSEIIVGHIYAGVSGHTRKVLEVDGDRVRYEVVGRPDPNAWTRYAKASLPIGTRRWMGMWAFQGWAQRGVEGDATHA